MNFCFSKKVIKSNKEFFAWTEQFICAASILASILIFATLGHLRKIFLVNHHSRSPDRFSKNSCHPNSNREFPTLERFEQNTRNSLVPNKSKEYNPIFGLKREIKMTFLSSLKFAALHDFRPSPPERRRMRLIENLKNQLILIDEPSHCLTRSKWIKDGQQKRLIQKTVPVRPWWREMPNGQFAFFIKSGLKKVEFKKGQSAILVESKVALPSLINGLIEAVRSGELDALLTSTEERRGVPQKKAA